MILVLNEKMCAAADESQRTVNEQAGGSQSGEALLRQFFPQLSPQQIDALKAYALLLRDWNDRVNLVSRKDTANIELHHICHALAITHPLKLMQGARLVDVGTGGGLPGIPLAICYPQAQFTLVDSIAKKVAAVADMIEALGLKNARAVRARAETLPGKYDFVLGRAVTSLDGFLQLVKGLLRPGRKHSLVNGVLYWKGGRWEEELAGLGGLRPRQVYSVTDFVADEYFAEKYILHFAERDLGRVKSKGRTG